MTKAIEYFKVFSENYAKPFLSNPRITTGILVLLLTSAGFNVYTLLGLDVSKPEPAKEIPRPVYRAPDPVDLGPTTRRIDTLETRDRERQKRIRKLEKIHE